MNVQEAVQNFTHTVHDDMLTAEKSIEYFIYAVLIAVVCCILTYVLKIVSCIRWCCCPKQSSGYNNL